MPVSMDLLSLSTLSVLASSKNLYPEYHNFTSESSEKLPRAGTMCALHADAQIVCRSISETWVESMVAPLGILILMGFWVRHLLSTGQDILRQEWGDQCME